GAGTGIGPGLRVSLPVRTERVVALPLLRVGEHRMSLGDLLEALRRALVDVRMMLPGELSVRRLDRLLVGVPRDSQRLVVVLEVHVPRKESGARDPRVRAAFSTRSVADGSEICGSR